MTAPDVRADRARRVWRLYLARFVFAVVWAAVLGAIGGSLGALTVTLLVLYPVVDVAAAVVDLRLTGNRLLAANIAVSTLAAVGLAIASAADIPAVLRAFGVWAVVAGAIQLGIAISRRAAGGQWPMILSGGISVLVGLSFIATSADASSVRGIAGYAAAGGVFFLVSALRLRQSTATARPEVG